ncbi:hypothetical protein CDAR_281761 [Caerostris darwini]|uniref:Uncharacterized protein n=1 Tax=Caerostris darwini TaxID=1538125 RepID=A0AAV4WR35_9ARAC|nr:hypothetical protein CDAR_281761 [Caerostris darwini]
MFGLREREVLFGCKGNEARNASDLRENSFRYARTGFYRYFEVGRSFLLFVVPRPLLVARRKQRTRKKGGVFGEIIFWGSAFINR